MKIKSAYFVVAALAVGGCATPDRPFEETLPGGFLTKVGSVFDFSGPNDLIAPSAKVVAIAVVDQSAEGVRIQATIELKSDNTYPLPLVKCDYSVTLAGVGVFTFSERPNRAIPAKRTDINAGPAKQIVTLIAAFATQADVKGRSCTVGGSVTYEPPGEIRRIMTETAVPLPSVTFSGTATLE